MINHITCLVCNVYKRSSSRNVTGLTMSPKKIKWMHTTFLISFWLRNKPHILEGIKWTKHPAIGSGTGQELGKHLACAFLLLQNPR